MTSSLRHSHNQRRAAGNCNRSIGAQQNPEKDLPGVGVQAEMIAVPLHPDGIGYLFHALAIVAILWAILEFAV